jgi:uncharacterized protein
MLDTELIKKTEAFLQEMLQKSPYFEEHPAALDYRLEHSYRVANIGRTIAQGEGFSETDMVVAGKEDWLNHGRRAAELARTFLESEDLAAERIAAICYGIAIHVDDEADFPGERTPFAESVGDADNIDRFDAYRIYEILQMKEFSEMSLSDKETLVNTTLSRLTELQEMKLGTKTAQAIWHERLNFYREFYLKLQEQLANSSSII